MREQKNEVDIKMSRERNWNEDRHDEMEEKKRRGSTDIVRGQNKKDSGGKTGGSTGMEKKGKD